MAVGDGTLSALSAVPGVRLATVAAGIRYPDRRDLVMFEFAEQAVVAGTFTRNAFCAAPVHVARDHWRNGPGVRYWLVNTGNANAGTGDVGMRDAMACCRGVAELGGVGPGAVMPFSTGVIGEPLPTDPICAALPSLFAGLREDGWADAAQGIMTTDTRPKGASRQIEYQGQVFTLTGIAKGAGMIRPNMATMLAFLATDLAASGEIGRAHV